MSQHIQTSRQIKLARSNMMQSRRWWYSLGLTLALLAGGLSAPAATFVDPSTPEAARFAALKTKAAEIAKAPTAAEARKAAQDFIDVSTETRDIGFLNDYASGSKENPGVAQVVAELVNNPDVPAPNKVAAIVALAQVQLNLLPTPTNNVKVIAIDKTLIVTLKNANPAVRYWSAKCLAALVPYMRRDPAFARPGGPLEDVTKALTEAAKVETSPLARAQMLRGLALVGQVTPLIDGLKTMGDAMREKAPDANDFDVLIVFINALNDALDDTKLTKAQETAAASAVANAMSFPAQHLFNGKLDLTQMGKVVDGVRMSVQTLNTLGKDSRWITPPTRGADSATLLLAVDEITGAARPGKIQDKFKDVPSPPRVAK